MRKFYVFYDDQSGIIKAISPNYETDFIDYAVTQIPFETAFKFLNGEYSTTGWYVSSLSSESEGVLTQDQFDLQPQVDDELTMVPRKDYMVNLSSAIDLTLIPIEGRIEVSVPEIKVKLDLKGKPDMLFYVTKRNDPSEVYLTFSVNIEELFEKKTISFPFDGKFKDCSIYTKKVFRFYQMSIQHTRKKMSQQGGHMRHNTLVEYKYTKKPVKADNGINIVHNINTNTLKLNITGDTSHIPHYVTDVMLMLTKPRDPMVLIDTVTYDIQKLIDLETLTIDLPDNVGTEFGISSYPHMEQLTFTRK